MATSTFAKQTMDKARRIHEEGALRRRIQQKLDDVFDFIQNVFGSVLKFELKGSAWSKIRFLEYKQIDFRYQVVNDKIEVNDANLLAEKFLGFALRNLATANRELQKEEGAELRKAEEAIDRVVRRIGKQPSDTWLEAQGQSELHRITERGTGAVDYWISQLQRAEATGISEPRRLTAGELVESMKLLEQGLLYRRETDALDDEAVLQFLTDFLALELTMAARVPQVFFQGDKKHIVEKRKYATGLWRGKSARKHAKEKRSKQKQQNKQGKPAETAPSEPQISVDEYLNSVGVAGVARKGILEAGYPVSALKAMSADKLAEIPGVGPATVAKILPTSA